MGNADSVKSLLGQISELLRSHGEVGWADSLQRLASEYESSPQATKAKVRSIYGGMESFNDIVLHDSGARPLGDENDALNTLRSRLYAECWT